MIFVRDKGQMCNNMLQYGHVYAWAREHGLKTVSMRFSYKYQYFRLCDTRYHHFLTYVFAKYGARWGMIPVVDFDEEGGASLEKEQQLEHARLVVAQGWHARWYDLFLKYRQEIVELFAFHDDIEKHVSGLLSDGLRIGVHIRRGDYAHFHNGRFMYSDEQYAEIVRQCIDRIRPTEKKSIYICGNDPALNRSLFESAFPDCRVVFPDGNPGEDLCLLSHCDYLIGAPSTFTLVASMYRDLPLYWIEDPNIPVSVDNFKKFDYLFQHIY